MPDHKLCVKHSATNDFMDKPPVKQGYPLTRWAMVAKLNAVNPEDHLKREMERFAKLFKQLYSEN